MQPNSHGHAVLVVNPAAGGVTDSLVDAAVAECRRWWAEVSVHRLGPDLRADDVAATALALRGGAATVVVPVGGDGTVRDLAAALAGVANAPAMFVIPAGTGNSCYRTWWGEQPWPRALATAASDIAGRTLRHDLARLEETGELVLSGAATGFSAQAIHEAKQLTGLTGRARYEVAATNLIGRFTPYPGRVLVDGVQVHRGPTLLANVGGSRFRGGQFELLPHSLLDDGRLDVCVISGEHDPADMLRAARTATHVDARGVVYARGRRVRLERTDGRPMWFEHDGEVLFDVGSAVTLCVVPRAVAILAGPSARPRSSWRWPAGLAVAKPR